MKKTTQIALVLAMVFAVATSSNAQRWAASDGSAVTNPNSGADFSGAGPVFTYYSTDSLDGSISAGTFTISNAGANGTVDSTDNASLAGDDFGMISFISTHDGSTNATLSLATFEDNVLWNTFNPDFNGKIQLSGSTTPAGQFLPIVAGERELFQLTPGLAAANFQDDNGNIKIETGVNFADGTQGATLFSVGDPIASGAFVIVNTVPEPTAMILFGSALMGLFGIARRRRS